MGGPGFKIFVVEDDQWYNKLLVHSLSMNPDYEVHSFFDAKSLMESLHEKPNVVTLDYRLPETNGTEVLQKIKAFDERIEVIVISEQADIETAVNLLKEGAFDYLVKTKDIRDRLLNVVQHIRNSTGLQKRIQSLEEEVQKKYDFQKSIIGQSSAIQKVFQILEKAIKTNITVTISGETGTGKELVAKALHYNSVRKSKPFVPVNVAAIPSELLESELFGHEKGAFTGANARRKGKFEEAHGGTIFLDEIGEMELSFQAKLLRVLQEKEVTRLGGNEQVKIDARIVVATHRDLKKEVAKGNFREDLYYRLFGLPIHLPSLRERDKDILLLADFFASEFSKENDLPKIEFSRDAKNALMQYHWPGNVRELKSVVELAMVMTNGTEVQKDDLSFTEDPAAMFNLAGEEKTLRAYNIDIVSTLLKKYDNDTKKVAQILDIGQTTIYRMLKEKG